MIGKVMHIQTRQFEFVAGELWLEIADYMLNEAGEYQLVSWWTEKA